MSVAAYSLIWGWEFAAGFVVLIFVHEMGHVIALRREGIRASAPMFIPFMGAVIWRPLARRQRAGRGPRGPRRAATWALAAAAVVAIVGAATHSGLLEALGYIGFLLNLFNLLPVVPLDGGRAMAAMAPWMWFVGFGALVALEFLAPNPILLIISLFAAYELYRRWQRRKLADALQTAYYSVAPRNRIVVGAAYIGLIVALAIGMHFTYVHRAIRTAADGSAPAISAARPRRDRPRVRDASRSVDLACRRSVSRLSWMSLPRASAISTLARGAGEVDARGHERQPALRGARRQAVDLAAVQQQLAFALGLVVLAAGGRVGRDVHVAQPELAAADRREAVLELRARRCAAT